MPEDADDRLGRAQEFLSRNLARWRQEHDLLLKQVAPDLGVSITTLHDWETGRRFPTGEHLDAISRYTGVAVCRLFCPDPEHWLVCGGSP